MSPQPAVAWPGSGLHAWACWHERVRTRKADWQRVASPCSSCEDGAGFRAPAHVHPTAVLAPRESGSVVTKWRELLAESKQPGASQGCCVDDLGMLERFSEVC